MTRDFGMSYCRASLTGLERQGGEGARVLRRPRGDRRNGAFVGHGGTDATVLSSAAGGPTLRCFRRPRGFRRYGAFVGHGGTDATVLSSATGGPTLRGLHVGHGRSDVVGNLRWGYERHGGGIGALLPWHGTPMIGPFVPKRPTRV
jgi:hypothetical protein